MFRPSDLVAIQGGAWPPPTPPPPPPGGYGAPGGHGSPAAPPGGAGYARPKPITGSPETIAMHALTIDPRTGLPKGERPPASTASVVALVCGILLCLPLAGAPAIVAGLIGRRRAREQPHLVGGARMSLAGVLLGSLNLIMTALLALYVVLTALK